MYPACGPGGFLISLSFLPTNNPILCHIPVWSILASCVLRFSIDLSSSWFESLMGKLSTAATTTSSWQTTHDRLVGNSIEMPEPKPRYVMPFPTSRVVATVNNKLPFAHHNIQSECMKARSLVFYDTDKLYEVQIYSTGTPTLAHCFYMVADTFW